MTQHLDKAPVAVNRIPLVDESAQVRAPRITTSVLIQRYLQIGQENPTLQPQTLKAYTSDLRLFASFLFEQFPSAPESKQNTQEWNELDSRLLAVTTKDVQAYIDRLRSNSTATTTVLRKRAVIQGFYTKLGEEGLVSENPAQKLILPKRLKAHEEHILTPNQFERLLKSFGPEYRDRLFHAFLTVIVSAAARPADVINLSLNDISNVGSPGACNHLRFARRWSDGTPRERFILLDDAAAKTLRKFLELREARIGKSSSGNRSASDRVFSNGFAVGSELKYFRKALIKVSQRLDDPDRKVIMLRDVYLMAVQQKFRAEGTSGATASKYGISTVLMSVVGS